MSLIREEHGSKATVGDSEMLVGSRKFLPTTVSTLACPEDHLGLPTA